MENVHDKTIEGFKVYHAICSRFEDYEIGMQYELGDNEIYDEVIMLETRKSVIVFYYRDFDHLTNEEVINIMIDKITKEGTL